MNFICQSDAEREALSKATEAGGEYLWEEEAEGKGERRFIYFVLYRKVRVDGQGKPFTIPERTGYKQTPKGNEKGGLEASIAHTKVRRQELACYQRGLNSWSGVKGSR